MALAHTALNDYLYGQSHRLTPSEGYLRAFGTGDPYADATYNPTQEYNLATGKVADPTSNEFKGWIAGQVLGGLTPQQWFDRYNRDIVGIDPATFQSWDIGGARFDPATGMVTHSADPGGDPFGGLAMGGALAFLGGVGALGSLGGITGGVDTGVGGLAGGSGAAGEIAALTGSGGSGAGFGLTGGATSGLGALPGVDPSWGVNTNSVPSILNQPAPTQTFIGDPALGGVGSSLADLTALAPTQNLGTGALFNGATGAVGGALGAVGTPNVGGGGGTTTGTGTNAAGGAMDMGVGGVGESMGLGGGYTSPAATAGAGTALSRILGGTATEADWLSALGTAGSTLLGMYGSNQQADSLRQIADQARADRQPFLNQSLAWMNDPAAYAAGPGKSALDATLRALSVNGNPIGNPTSLALAGDIANRGWQNAVTGFANIGLSGQDSRNSLLAGAAGQDSNALSALGYGIGQLTQPQNSLESLLRQLRGGLNTGTGLV